MKAELTIGKILRPRGLNGVVKVETYTEDPSRLAKIKRFKVGGVMHEVEQLYNEGGFSYFKFSGVDTIESAEAMRGKLVTCGRSELPPPPEGRFYIVDLVGADVIVAGEVIGELTDVLQYGSADVYVVRTADGSVSFPALKELVTDVDIAKGIVTLDARMFERTAVYNRG